ncbi:DUF2769 domain-containing protein [[Eubacterium] cellulosolvens]
MRKVADTKNNLLQCICIHCLTFRESPYGGFFCARGLSKEKPRQSGCICGNCPLFAKYNLRVGYFCIK